MWSHKAGNYVEAQDYVVRFLIKEAIVIMSRGSIDAIRAFMLTI